jgi:DNA-binding NarL/FixJ family response regulator
VLLVDDHVVVREGLRLLLDSDERTQVVGEASSIRESAALNGAVDLVITELALPDGYGGDVIAGLVERHPRARILVLTRLRHPARVQRAIAAGAHGYLLKTASTGELLAGVHVVANGGMYVQPGLGVSLARNAGPGGEIEYPGGIRLSQKEEDVLRQIALGYANVEIAQATSMSLRTVEAHRASIVRKLRAGRRADLVRYALASGIVDSVHL